MAYFLTIASSTAVFVEETAKSVNRKPTSEDFEASTWLLAQIGWGTSAPKLLHYQNILHQTTRAMSTFFQQYDVLMTPTLARPPVAIGHFELSLAERLQLAMLRALPLRPLLNLALKALGNNALGATPNTQLFNMTGHPAMSVPLYWSPSGLPIGIQFGADAGKEDVLFQLAAQLEEARPCANLRPPIVDPL